MTRLAALFLIPLTGLMSSAAAPAPAIAAGGIVVEQPFDIESSSPIVATGLTPGERVMLVARRSLSKWQPKGDGTWQQAPVALVAWASFVADRSGRVDVGRSVPIDGSYSMADPLGLLWSGYPAEDPHVARSVPLGALDAPPPDGAIGISLLRDGHETAYTVLDQSAGQPKVDLIGVKRPGLIGVLASPAGARRLPTMIILHGSEGGSIAKATASATAWAQRGFAVLALVWSTQPWEAVEGVPISGQLIDMGQLDRAREWLAARPEADADRIALYGVSKGGEMAMVGAATYPWVKAAVGCVPSDIVWQGFGEGENDPPPRSTWMLDRRPLPFVPLFAYVDGRYRDNTDRYERSRRYNADAALAARIPIERSDARLLLIGSDRDEVWASGRMVRNIADTMARAGRGDRVEVVTDPRAGHMVCGDGSFPERLYGVDSEALDMKSLDAEGHANVLAYRRTLAFLRSALR